MPIDLAETTTVAPVAYAYARVSTITQVKNGTSLEDQQQKTRAYYDYQLKGQGVLWGDMFTDAGISAAKNALRDRPAGRELVSRIRPGDHVIMTRLDRGFRNTGDACEMTETWLKKGINVHFLDLGVSTSGVMGRFLLRILACVAELQRDVIIENISAGKARVKALTGTSNGKPGIGNKFIGHGKLTRRIVPDEKHRAIGMLAMKLKEEEGKSLLDIKYIFKDHGVTNKGKGWSEQCLYQLIHRAKRDSWTTPAMPLPPLLEPVKTGNPGRPARHAKATPIEVSPTTLSSTPLEDFYSETSETAPTMSSIATES